ncbi:hypothetical protein IMZ48_16185, partial [Candidatus Bathyarchaeota archaeon]|nr:hypothetical protein [Candidatus Bathyarchaeota archaeon]
MQPRDHPDFPRVPFRDSTETPSGKGWFNEVARSCENFVEATGDAGDIYLLHPLMLHTASNNTLRHVRIITNPPIGIKEPFCFDRADGAYSLVEKATLRALGKEDLKGWGIKGAREAVVPDRIKVQEEMKRKELERF